MTPPGFGDEVLADEASTAREGAPSLALIVGAARSGTTLLRLLFDAHRDIGAPAEAGIPALASHLARVWSAIDADVIGAGSKDPGTLPPDQAKERGGSGSRAGLSDTDDTAASGLSVQARGWIRDTVHVPMVHYTAQGTKSVYVDKSLDSVHYLPLVQELFPSARYVLVFRHVMDTVASGLEASPWGFNAYGYAPYVAASPGNAVAALANYWLTHATAALKWEEAWPDLCCRVRYEDLVLRPECEIRRIQSFLGVAEDVSVLARAFDGEAPKGPGDYKVGYTANVHARSVGHGKRVPVAMLPPPLLEALNEKLTVLGYEALSRSWNAEERPVDDSGRGFWARRLADLMDTVRLSPNGHSAIGSFALVAEDHRTLRWVIDPEHPAISRGDGEVESVVTGTAEDLVLLLTGEENLGVLLRSGRVRHLAATEDQRPRDVGALLNHAVTLLRGGFAKGPQEPMTGPRGRVT